MIMPLGTDAQISLTGRYARGISGLNNSGLGDCVQNCDRLGDGCENGLHVPEVLHSMVFVGRRPAGQRPSAVLSRRLVWLGVVDNLSAPAGRPTMRRRRDQRSYLHAGPAAEEAEDQDDHGDYEQQVNEPAADASEQAEKPENGDDDGCPKAA